MMEIYGTIHFKLILPHFIITVCQTYNKPASFCQMCATPQSLIVRMCNHHKFRTVGQRKFIQHFFGVYDRTYLQQVESTRFILFAAHGGGKLYLDGAAHFLLTVLQYQL